MCIRIFSFLNKDKAILLHEKAMARKNYAKIAGIFRCLKTLGYWQEDNKRI